MFHLWNLEVKMGQNVSSVSFESQNIVQNKRSVRTLWLDIAASQANWKSHRWMRGETLQSLHCMRAPGPQQKAKFCPRMPPAGPPALWNGRGNTFMCQSNTFRFLAKFGPVSHAVCLKSKSAHKLEQKDGFISIVPKHNCESVNKGGPHSSGISLWPFSPPLLRSPLPLSPLDPDKKTGFVLCSAKGSSYSNFNSRYQQTLHKCSLHCNHTSNKTSVPLPKQSSQTWRLYVSGLPSPPPVDFEINLF